MAFLEHSKVNDKAGIKRMIPVPDYANIESINRISTVLGSWTADRTGYIRVAGTTTAGANVVFAIDGCGFLSIPNAAVMYIIGIAFVAEGQVVTCTGGQGTTGQSISCFFIPIKWVEV